MRNLPIHRRNVLRLTAAAAAAGTIPAARAQAPAEVKVALLAPISGPWARQGLQMQAGAEMAIDEINVSGGIGPLGGARMKLMVFDAGDSVEKAKDAAQRMVAQNPDLVGGTGAWLSSFTLAVTEVTERDGLPWLTLSYSDIITGRGFRNVFQTALVATQQSSRALPVALALGKSVGVEVQRVGILTDNNASSVSFLKPIRETELPARGIKLVMDEVYTPPLSDVTSLVQLVRRTKPQLLLLLASNVPDNKLLLDKMTELGLGHGKVPLLGNGGAMVASEMLNQVGKDQLDGLMVIVANWGGKGQEALTKRFQARTKEPWMSQDSLQSYFDMMLLREVIGRAGAVDRQKVAEVLRTIDITGGPALLLPGRRVKFDEKGRIVDADLVIVQWQDGIPVPVYPPAMATATAIWPES
jgi:branched-chain amino acid transport system substrate-binding protein